MKANEHEATIRFSREAPPSGTRYDVVSIAQLGEPVKLTLLQWDQLKKRQLANEEAAIEETLS